MSFQNRKYVAFFKILLGLIIAALAMISTLISLLKGIYFSMQNSLLSPVLNTPIEYVYAKTKSFMSLFWLYSPIIDILNQFNKNMIIFILVYLLFIVGMMFFSSGKEYLSLVARVNKEMYEKGLINEIIGVDNKQEIQEKLFTLMEKKASILSSIHTVYLAPIIVGVISALVIKWLNV